MPQKGDKQLNNFVGGLITEASDLSFPPNSSYEELNMDLIRNGSRERRLGLDYEDGYTLHGTGLTANQIKSSRQRVFVWPTPSGFTEVEIGVVQIGTKLFFIDLFSASPSSAVLNGGNGLDASSVSTIIDPSTPFSFTIVNNNLIVVSEGLDTPFLLKYDYDTDTISYQTARIKIRDLYGVNDGLAVDERPTTLTDTHKYNLRNQGWSSNIITKNGDEVLDETFNVIGVYPSNSDSWSLGKIADVTSADVDKYDAETLKRNSFDIGNAARGHFIIDLYDRGASREEESGIPQDKVDREIGRISAVASLGGRLFYSGIRSRVLESDRSPKLGGAVLFSQIARTNADLVKCYQEADPTSPNISDLVDTDGGIIHITEAANIIEIKAIKSSIFAFAENGIWEIRGDDDGFRATSFQVNKISSVGVLARESIVEANGTIFFWGEEGIFTLSPNQLGTGYDTVNITIDSIQSAYNTIPPITKIGVKGYYDVSKNRIRWLFNSEEDGVPIGVEDPDPIVFAESNILSDTTILGDRLDIVKLSSTDFVVVTGKGSFPNLYVGMVLYRYDSATKTLTEVVKQTKLASLSQIIHIRAVPVNANKFVLLTRSTGGGTQARFVDVADSGFTEGSPTTLTISASYVLSDVAVLDNTRCLCATHRPSNPTEYFVLNYSTGSFVQGTTYKHTDVPQIADELYTLSSSKVFATSQDKIRQIDISTSDVVTVNAGFVSSGTLTTGGNQHIGINGGSIIAANTRQLIMVTSTNPPTFLYEYNDVGTDAFGIFDASAGLNPRVFHKSPSNSYHFNRFYEPDTRYRPYYQQISSTLGLVEQKRIMSSQAFTNGTTVTASLPIGDNQFAVAVLEQFNNYLYTQVIELP